MNNGQPLWKIGETSGIITANQPVEFTDTIGNSGVWVQLLECLSIVMVHIINQDHHSSLSIILHLGFDWQSKQVTARDTPPLLPKSMSMWDNFLSFVYTLPWGFAAFQLSSCGYSWAFSLYRTSIITLQCLQLITMSKQFQKILPEVLESSSQTHIHCSTSR